MHERDIERQNFIAVRKLSKMVKLKINYILFQNIKRFILTNYIHLDAADNMEPKTSWRYLDDSLLVDLQEELGKDKIEPGSGSQEKKKQTLREQSVLQAIYFTRNM